MKNNTTFEFPTSSINVKNLLFETKHIKGT